MTVNDWNNSITGRADAHVLAGSPVPFRNVLGESVPRAFASLDAVAVLGSGQLRCTAIPLQIGIPVTGLAFASDAVAGTSNLVTWAGLYDNSGPPAFLRQSSGGFSYNWPANTVHQFDFTSTYTPTYTGIYIAVILSSAGGATPTLTAMAQPAAITGITPIRSFTANSGITGGAPATLSSIAAAAHVPYCYAY
jgi:hypothetical protein